MCLSFARLSRLPIVYIATLEADSMVAGLSEGTNVVVLIGVVVEVAVAFSPLKVISPVPCSEWWFGAEFLLIG